MSSVFDGGEGRGGRGLLADPSLSLTLSSISALVGFAVLVIGIPLQAYLFSVMIGTRQQRSSSPFSPTRLFADRCFRSVLFFDTEMKVTDNRVRLLQEVLQGIRVISTFRSSVL